MKIETVVLVQRRLTESMENIYDNAARFQWSSADLNRYVVERIWNDGEFHKLPLYAKTYLQGARYVLERQHWRKVEQCSHTGAFTYKEAPHKLFTESRLLEQKNE